MLKNKRHIGLIFLLIIISPTVAACQKTRTSTTTELPVESMTIRLAVLPILDTLPMYAADQEGLFEKQNLKVEFIPVGSAPERDQVIAAGQADGMVNEALSTAFFNKEVVQAQVVRYARAATSTNALFSILAAANSEINKVNDLKGVQIGISQGTVIEYLTDRLLQEEGFAPSEIQGVAVPKIDDRMNLLSTGSLKAAMLPEPLTTLAKANGARVILDDSSHPEYSYSTITFRKAVIDEHPEAVRSFLAAIEEAVELINASPEKYENLLVERKVVPPALQGKFKVPPFVSAGVPSETQWDDMINWAVEKGLLEQKPQYADSVNGNFLPK
jgi:NitT/TauT family transport system substrate-binding protein